MGGEGVGVVVPVSVWGWRVGMVLGAGRDSGAVGGACGGRLRQGCSAVEGCGSGRSLGCMMLTMSAVMVGGSWYLWRMAVSVGGDRWFGKKKSV